MIRVTIYIYNKRKKHTKVKKTEEQVDQTLNLLVNVLMFVCSSYLFCNFCKYCVVEDMMSTSEFEYE